MSTSGLRTGQRLVNANDTSSKPVVKPRKLARLLSTSCNKQLLFFPLLARLDPRSPLVLLTIYYQTKSHIV